MNIYLFISFVCLDTKKEENTQQKLDPVDLGCCHIGLYIYI